ncbi:MULTISPECIES: DUF736 domain-containing protein [unclassified Sphingomonas]|uniref:DUF736 domain-containing protein n=1 Tax=unclassified Sphingomonas TaxID=196159 RepID=UPI00226A151E|nr:MULTISPECIES: DUF736 domain-containing protein [unclassified Sphingomonas]
MASIGTFIKNADGSYIGEIVTLSVQAKNVRITPDENQTGENAATHVVTVGRAEIGAGWVETSNEGRRYLSLEFDDPSFIAPIYANLFEDADGKTHSLIWSRSNRRNAD